MKIHGTIDRLSLEGVTVPHGERQALEEAVARLRGGNVEWFAGGGAVTLGQGIARAVVPSLGVQPQASHAGEAKTAAYQS